MNKITLRYILLVFLNGLLLGNLSHAASPDYTCAFASVKDFGATGNNQPIDTTAITAAINWCLANGYKTLYFPNGTYDITVPLPTLTSGFNVLSLVGESPNQTILNASSVASGASVLSTYGGSGLLTGAEIRDLSIIGNGTQIGILNQGTDGLKFYDCIFNNLAIGIEFSNNIAPGTFTEFSVAENCSFNSGCITPVEYVRGAGDLSFQGSGLKGCTIVNAAGNNSPAIVVGAPGETVYLYNAPLDFQIWTNSAMTIVSVPTTTNSIVTTHGTITVDNDAASGSPTVASGGTLYHVGDVNSWVNCIYGTLHLENAVKTDNNAVVEDRKPYRVQTILSASTTAISGIEASPYGTLVSVTLEGANYDYRYQLCLVDNGYGPAGVVTILANPISTNTSGWGAPTFSVDASSILHIANSKYAGKSVTMTAAVIPSSCPDSWSVMEY